MNDHVEVADADESAAGIDACAQEAHEQTHTKTRRDQPDGWVQEERERLGGRAT